MDRYETKKETEKQNQNIFHESIYIKVLLPQNQIK